jgi:hypothetical protein
VRKFVRIALVICLAIAAVSIASRWLWGWYKAAQVESFYREHPLLSEIRARQKASPNDSAAARQAFLEIVPLGTDREAAIDVLRKEGFGRKPIAESITDTQLRQRFLEARGLTNIPNNGRTRKDSVNCQMTSPAVLGYTHWITDLGFDADGRLSKARTAMWNIFL